LWPMNINNAEKFKLNHAFFIKNFQIYKLNRMYQHFTFTINLKKLLRFGFIYLMLISGAAQAQQVFTWIADGDGEWSNPDNWSPRDVPPEDGIVRFNHDETFFISNIPTGTIILGMVFEGKGTTFLKPQAPGNILLIGVDGDPNSKFRIDAQATAIIYGPNESQWYLSPGTITSIKGTFVMMGDESTPTNHAIIPMGEPGLKFEAGGRFIQGNGFARFSGHPFGSEDDGMEPMVIFMPGSKLIQNDGEDPFGPFPTKKVKFEKGSTFEFGSNNEGIQPVLPGRSISNFIFNSFNEMTVVGQTSMRMDNLQVKAAKLTFGLERGSNTLTITGDIILPDNANNPDRVYLEFAPIGTSTLKVLMDGEGGERMISGKSTIAFNNRSNLTIAAGLKVNMTSNIILNRSPVVNGYGDFIVRPDSELNIMGENSISGTGRFFVSSGATLGVGSKDGINFLGELGNVRTLGRFFQSANYRYIGTENQVTGTGLPTWNNSAPRPSITVATRNGATVSLTNANIKTSTLRLESGSLNLNGKTLRLRGLTNGAESPFPADIIAAANTAIVAETGTLIFEGAGRVTATGKVLLGGTIALETGIGTGLDFGTTGEPTLTGELQIRTGGSVVNNPPYYATGSRLTYATNTTFTVKDEWMKDVDTGRGVPVNVVVGIAGVNNTKIAFTGEGITWHCTGLMRVGGPGVGTGAGVILNNGAYLTAGPAASGSL